MFTLASLAACSQTSDLSIALSFSTYIIMIKMVMIMMVIIVMTMMIVMMIMMIGIVWYDDGDV